MTRRQDTSGKPEKTTRNKGKITAEDAALWQHVTDSVKPLRRPRRAAAPPPTSAPARPATKSAPAPSRSSPAPRATAAPPTPPNKGFDRATATKFKRGTLEIEGRLDLHGMTQEAAYRALMRFIERARAAEKRTLLVITGKGRLSEGGGVLRRLLPQWLESGPHAGAVLACTTAHAKDGGTGAYYIRLRKSRT